MKVDGWLEKAQFENLANASPTPTPTGRVYADTTQAAAAVPRFYNGTAWLPFLLGQSTSLVSQNSGTSVTVNWSTGLNQKVVLTGHSIISFSNPQPGQVHTLVVTQRETAFGLTPYVYRFNMPDQLTRRGAYQPQGVLQSGESQVHSWFYSAGAKAAYATVPARAADPGSLPSTAIFGLDVHPTLKTLVGGRSSSPYTTVYQFADAGAKFIWGANNVVTPATAAGQPTGIAFHPEGHSVYLSTTTSPYIQGWFADLMGSTAATLGATALSNPGTLPTGGAQCIAVHPSGSHVVVGHGTTPFMSCYPINPGAFGTKVTNPVSLPAARVDAVAWSPVGDYLATAGGSTPYLEVYPFDPGPGFGTKVAAPSPLPGGGPPNGIGKSVCWHPSGAYIALAISASPYFYIVPFSRASGTFGTPMTITSPGGPAAAGYTCQFSPCGNYLLVGNATTLYVYDFSAQTIGAPLAYDVAGPLLQVNDIAFHPSGELVTLGLNASPYLMTYPMPRVAKNYIRLTD